MCKFIVRFAQYLIQSILLKVFEVGFGEELFEKSSSPSNSFYFVRLQSEGVNRRSNGKISSLPRSISTLSTSFEKSEYAL